MGAINKGGIGSLLDQADSIIDLFTFVNPIALSDQEEAMPTSTYIYGLMEQSSGCGATTASITFSLQDDQFVSVKINLQGLFIEDHCSF